MPKKDSIEEQRRLRTPGSEYPRASEMLGYDRDELLQIRTAACGRTENRCGA